MDDKIAWYYKLEGIHYTHRTEKYAKIHPGLVDKDLTSDGTIESPSSEYKCMDLSVSTNDLFEVDISISYDPALQTLSIEIEDQDQISIYGYDLMGRIVLSNVNFRKGDNLDVGKLEIKSSSYISILEITDL
jgi:hypothetical protein